MTDTSDSDNLSLVLHGVKDLRLEQREIPEPGPNEVQIRIHEVGICGSDVAYWQNGGIGDFIVKSPMVMGHEPSGVISKVGPGVTSLKVGDRVAVEPGVPCRTCLLCKRGRYNLCRSMAYCATPPTHGTLTRYFVHPHDFCHRLPDTLTLEDGALLQPLAIGVHACERANIQLGSRVLICGAGPMGVFCMVAAKAAGAAAVCVTEVDHLRLALARGAGADHAVLVGGHGDGKEAQEKEAEQVEQALGEQPDCAIECSGSPTAQRLAILCVKSGGKAVFLGFNKGDTKLPMAHIIGREVDVIGTIRFAADYPKAIAMVKAGKVDTRGLITHRYRLEEAMDAFEAAQRKEGIKIIIKCS